MKILVTGNAGSGKSTVSKQIAKQYGLDCYSLDKIVWKERWQKASKENQKTEISKLISNDSWVIDGVDYDVLRAADKIIFLDIPRRICFHRAAKRNSRYLLKSRPELPANCPEILIVPKLVKIIWNFPKRVKPKILTEKSKRNSRSFIHIEDKDQLKTYLSQS